MLGPTSSGVKVLKLEAEISLMAFLSIVHHLSECILMSTSRPRPTLGISQADYTTRLDYRLLLDKHILIRRSYTVVVEFSGML